MTPKIIQTPDDPTNGAIRRVDDRPVEATAEDRKLLRPELREALEASWARNEAAYRYLGR